MKKQGGKIGGGKPQPGRAYDPLLWCMVIAMVLAIASSVTLRAVLAGNSEEPPAARMIFPPLTPPTGPAQAPAATSRPQP